MQELVIMIEQYFREWRPNHTFFGSEMRCILSSTSVNLTVFVDAETFYLFVLKNYYHKKLRFATG